MGIISACVMFGAKFCFVLVKAQGVCQLKVFHEKAHVEVNSFKEPSIWLGCQATSAALQVLRGLFAQFHSNLHLYVG